MLSTSRDKQRIDSHITGNNYTFERVNEFIYLGCCVTTKNDVSLAIKRMIILANKFFYGLSSREQAIEQQTTKLILYNTLMLTTILYGAEAWTVLSIDA